MRVVAATPAVIAQFLKLARPDLMRKADPYQQSVACRVRDQGLTGHFSQELMDSYVTSRCRG